MEKDIINLFQLDDDDGKKKRKVESKGFNQGQENA